jgi:hypothetical protein
MDHTKGFDFDVVSGPSGPALAMLRPGPLPRPRPAEPTSPPAPMLDREPAAQDGPQR